MRVETSVAQTVRQKSCGLKPEVQESCATKRATETYGVRFRAGELSHIKLKAQIAGITTNSYIRASVLASEYKPPLNPELHKLLVALNLELTAQGRNLNQITKQVNIGSVSGNQVIAVIDVIRAPLVRALNAVKNALVQGAPQP